MGVPDSSFYTFCHHSKKKVRGRGDDNGGESILSIEETNVGGKVNVLIVKKMCVGGNH